MQQATLATLSQVSLQPPASFPELYQELWWYSGAVTSSTSTSSGTSFLQRGSTTMGASSTTAAKLHTFSANWSNTTKCAFEATIYNSTASDTTNAALWDITAGSIVSGSQISVTTTTATVVRSGQVTLTPGHIYGVTVWCNAGTANITDASLIIFPPAGSVSPSLSSISLANPSGGTLKEGYYPLWIYSSGSTNFAVTTAGAQGSFLAKGKNTGGNTSGDTNSYKLHSLNANWPSTQKFAFEVSIYMGSSSGATVYAELWDITSNTAVSASQVSTSTGTATVIRSGQFTLTPNHVYGVTVWTTNNGSASYYPYITKAYLVALGS